VRRRAAESTPALVAPARPLLPLLADDDVTVTEAAAWALGELGERAVRAGAIPALASVAREHGDPLGREAAVAALGALGDPAGLPAVLAACGDKPAVRRRAVLALAPFDGPDVDAALHTALEDRDWQVRQAAEDVLAG
jgi:HEAT repeat protein